MSNALYGRKAAEIIGVKKAPTLTSRAVRKGLIAVTEIISDAPMLQPTVPTTPDDAWLISLSTTERVDREMWVENKVVKDATVIPANHFTVADLRQPSSALFKTPFNLILFYLPKAAIQAIAEESGKAHIDELRLRPGKAIDDPILASLSQAITPALARPQEANQLFVDHVTRAVAAHAVHVYGEARDLFPAKGGLARWQQRRIFEMLDANLSGEISLDALAAECQISTRHLSRAFQQAMGMPPHRWLLQRRIEKAQDLLRGTRRSLAEVALDCGFADQSHFTRVFSQMLKVSPAVWRRQNGTGPEAETNPPWDLSSSD